MKVLICLDDGDGMLFNNRRQSRDIKVVEKVMEICQNNLYITDFSAKLFENFKTTVNNNMLEIATTNDFCFVENLEIKQYVDKIETIYIFKWNRRYPADFIFDRSILQGYEISQIEEFEGNSHEKITLEIWDKNREST